LSLFFVFIFACFAFSQSNGVSSSSSAADSKTTPAASNAKGGKVAIPPEKARPVSVPKITTAITIDGIVNEELWRSAAVFKDFYQTGPGYNTEPSKPTEVYVMYDEYNMYVAFKC